ncbi:MAG: hypothetical protein HY023_01065 [Chloroflexi bacterium]|nr:hypothetical protein [Chloroflexota bacterium]MBI3762005.1 hypothetical protein [Chloroflexota bacterium]
MHLHGSGRRNKSRPGWIGLLLAGATLTVVIVAVAKGGWVALAPFGFAALVIAALLRLMRATERAAK